MHALFTPEAAFGLLFVFFAIHSILDGYALGLGCLVPLVREKQEADRLVAHMAPFWESNEVWLVMAAGFLFAAFPLVYALVISTFYLPCMAVIGALVLRATALEFSYHDPARVRCWRALMGVGSLLVVFVAAAALGFVLRGFTFTAPETISGDISGALTAQPLLFGCAGVAFFAWHGILHLRMDAGGGPLSRRAGLVWLLALVLGVAAAGVWLLRMPSLLSRPVFWLGGAMSLGGLLASRILAGNGRWAFRASAAAIVGIWIAVATGLFPNILIAANHPAWTISIGQAVTPASSLRMVMIAAPILMIVIACYSCFVQKVVRRPRPAGKRP